MPQSSGFGCPSLKVLELWYVTVLSVSKMEFVLLARTSPRHFGDTKETLLFQWSLCGQYIDRYYY